MLTLSTLLDSMSIISESCPDELWLSTFCATMKNLVAPSLGFQMSSVHPADPFSAENTFPRRAAGCVPHLRTTPERVVQYLNCNPAPLLAVVSGLKNSFAGEITLMPWSRISSWSVVNTHELPVHPCATRIASDGPGACRGATRPPAANACGALPNRRGANQRINATPVVSTKRMNFKYSNTCSGGRPMSGLLYFDL